MAIKGKEKIMLACMGILIVFMASIFLRLGTRMVLVKKLQMDNGITRTVLFDLPILQLNNRPQPMDMHWQQKYPFHDAEQETQEEPEQGNTLQRLKTKAEAFEDKVKALEKDKIDKYASENLMFYHYMIENGMRWNNLIGWNIIDPAKEVYKFQDGYLTFTRNNDPDSQARIASIVRLSKFVESQGGKFLYVQSPGKANKYADRELDKLDYSNANSDLLLQGLAENHVDIYDLRPELRQAVGDEGWHRAFFRTDHHWKPDTALWGARKLAEKLQQDYQVDVNLSHLKLEDYRTEKYDKFFLGSQGKKVTLANTEPDDFELYYPLFETNIHWQIPSLGVDKTGDSSVMYDMSALGKGAMYSDNPYAVYGYGDMDLIQLHNYVNEGLKDKKILLIKDSFWDTGIFFLSTALKDVTVMDVRAFDGSVERYIQEHKPDVVILSSTIIVGDRIKWGTHKDKFDFR